jgi:tRNA-uridine 2-sulfurtransferase
MRVLVGMSGGVDSTVAAARLIAEGHQVSGVHLRLTDGLGTTEQVSGAAVADAQHAAELLGITLTVWDFSDRFREEVVADFLSEYAAGRTPNPCLRCNERIKFGAVLDRGLAEGFDAVATGHYARLQRTEETVSLYRAAALPKDQSYVLAVLTADKLQHCLFPLGTVSSKADVRAEAAALGLPMATKPDSNDICFIPEGGAAGFLAERLGERRGLIVDDLDNELGSHRGQHLFTIGQRHGLHLGVPAPDGRPRYVVAKDARTNTITVGARERLAVGGIIAGPPRWTERPEPGPWQGLVQVRAHGEAMPATITATEDRLHIELDQPGFGIACGQGAVLYDGDRVVGSATIIDTVA